MTTATKTSTKARNRRMARTPADRGTQQRADRQEEAYCGKLHKQVAKPA